MADKAKTSAYFVNRGFGGGDFVARAGQTVQLTDAQAKGKDAKFDKDGKLVSGFVTAVKEAKAPKKEESND